MEVILLERIDKLGQMGDVVNVKPGYARNFLLPQKKALRATKINMEQFESQRTQLEADNLGRRQEAEAVAEKLDGLTVVLIRQAGESGQLYGSVTARDIATAVTDAGFTVDRRQVLNEQPIKTLGIHPVRVALHPEVDVTVTANVAQSEEEAGGQQLHADAGEDPVAPPEAFEDAAEAADAAEEDAGAESEKSEKAEKSEESEESGAPEAADASAKPAEEAENTE